MHIFDIQSLNKFKLVSKFRLMTYSAAFSKATEVPESICLFNEWHLPHFLSISKWAIPNNTSAKLDTGLIFFK